MVQKSNGTVIEVATPMAENDLDFNAIAQELKAIVYLRGLEQMQISFVAKAEMEKPQSTPPMGPVSRRGSFEGYNGSVGL